MHLDAALIRIEQPDVAKHSRIEIGMRQFVDVVKHIFVERRRHTGGVVVGAAQHFMVFDQVNADQQAAARRRAVTPRLRQKMHRFVRGEIAD